MDWPSVARGWIEKIATTSNGELASTRKDYVHGMGISPETLHRYVRAYRFLDQLRLALEPFCAKQAGRSVADVLATLSALDVDQLRHIQRHSEKVFSAAIRAVVDGKRGSYLKDLWTTVQRGGALLDPKPENTNGFRSQARSSRAITLRKAADCCGAKGLEFLSLGPADLDAPFAVDAIISFEEKSNRFLGFRFLGTSGRPGHEVRLTQALASAFAAARGFHECYIVAQDQADAAGLASKLTCVGPCGVGIVTLDTAGNAFALHPAKRPYPRKQPDLWQALLRMLVRSEPV